MRSITPRQAERWRNGTPSVIPTQDAAPHLRDGRDETERIAKVSPEGRPAFASMRTRHFVSIMLALFGVVVLAGSLLALTIGTRAGFIALLIGAGVLMLLNPVLWAAVLRGEERDELDKQTTRRPGEDSRSLTHL
jgi:hypothetical protein